MKDKFFIEHKKLGLSIAYFRKYRGFTQKQLAHKLNINYETISRVENAVTSISLNLLLELANALDIPLSTLFSFAGL